MIGVSVVGAGVVGSLLGRWVLPTSPLPRPAGPLPVGTAVVEVEGARRLPVQIWYPAATAEGHPARLFPSPAVPEVIAAHYGIPPWVLRPLGRIRGHALDGVPARATTRGLALVVHGWMGFRGIHADLAEDLASDGWVVVAADHVGGALATQYPDGTATGLDPSLMPPDGAPDYGPRVTRLVRRFARDAAAVLDGVGALGAGVLGAGVLPDGLVMPPVRDVLVIGQSTGGGAAVDLARDDDRVGGVVGLDPWVEPVWPPERRVLSQPMIAVRSGQWIGNANDAVLRAMPGVELRAVEQAGHTDLTVLGYFTPLTRLTGLSRCDPALPHDAALAAIADVIARMDARSGI